MSKVAFVLCILTIILWSIVFIPILIHNGYKHFKLRNHIIMEKRYYNITLTALYIMIIKLFFGIIIFFAMISFPDGSPYYIALEIPYQFLSFMLLYSFVLRFWMIHYDTSFILSTVKQDWALIINERYKNSKTNWYIHNKLTYGNKKWCKYHIILPLIITQTLLITLPLIYFAFIHNFTAYTPTTTKAAVFHNIQLFSAVNLCIPFIFLLLIYLKTPAFNDQFFVSWELKRIFITLLIKNILIFIIFFYL